MKKQIFILLVALFAVTTAFGQYKNADPKVWAAPTCTGSEVNPAVGVEYIYSVGIAGPGYDGTGIHTWKVKTGTDLIAGADAPAGDYIATAGGVGDANIHITWNASSIGKTYYIVDTYKEQFVSTTDATCETNNMKVFEVQPRNTFWLDINASVDGTTKALTSLTSFDVCAPDVTKAEITTTGDPATARVTYEFGTTTLNAIITAGGYKGNFDAVLTVAGLKDNQKAAVPTGWTAGAGVDAMGNGTYTKSLGSTFAPIDIPVQLVITNNNYEGLADLPVTLTIDGTFTDGTTIFKDLYDQTTPAVTCTNQPDTGDYVIETIKARPTVTPTNPASFVTPSPALK